MSRLDKRASARSDMQHNAQTGTAKTSVNRIKGAETAIAEINSIAAEISAGLRAHTTDFNGKRLLANKMIQPWVNYYAPKRAEWQAKVDAFIANAPQYIAQAEVNKGDYQVAPPTMDEINKAFALDFEMTPIADTESYAPSGLTSEMEAHLKRHFESSMEAAYQSATQDAMKRVATPLKNLAEKMHAFSEREAQKARGLTVDKTGTFKDSITGNVDEIAAVFRSFNLTGDPFMEEIADKLDALVGIDPNDLRNDPALRKDTEKRANAILDTLKDLI